MGEILEYSMYVSRIYHCIDLRIDGFHKTIGFPKTSEKKKHLQYRDDLFNKILTTT